MRLSDYLGDDPTFVLQKGEATPVVLNEAVRSVLKRFPEVDASELVSTTCCLEVRHRRDGPSPVLFVTKLLRYE